MSFMRLAGGVAVTALLVVGCGDPDAAVPLDAPSTALTCTDDLTEIIELVRAGAPTYDYEPATDLVTLIERADVVVAGPLDRLIRGDDGTTIFFESSRLEHLGPTDVAAPASGFDLDWVWAERADDDPLATPVDLDRVEAVAFLFRRSDGSGLYTPDPQGIHVGCVGSDAAARGMLEAPPADATNLSVAELVTAVESVFAEPVGSSRTTPTSESVDVEATPLHRLSPVVTLGVDGTPLVELSLGFETWNGETAHPSEPEPAVGITVPEAASLDLAIEYPAHATTTFFRLDDQLRFVQHTIVEWEGTTVVTTAPGIGTWFVDIRAEFGLSSDYGGEGALRAGAWLQVVPIDSSCDTPRATPTNSPDAAVTGVIDSDGCPVSADAAKLDLDSLTPWFHCAPWPPTLQWRVDETSVMTRYWQYVSDPSAIDTVVVPDDAEPTGRFLPSGEVLTAASDPDALFVLAEDDTTERWFVPDDPAGCA